MSGGRRALFWDFHGTLIVPGPLWSKCLWEAASDAFPGLGLPLSAVREHLWDEGFTWHRPEQDYTHLREPDRWWAHTDEVFRRTLLLLGFSAAEAALVTPRVRAYILDPGRYRLYDDAAETLSFLAGQGWRHYIVSNHIPELPAIIESLGIGRFFSGYIVSALEGYEKPRREIFERALAMAGRPDICYMIGDSLEADGKGAEAAGIPAILVHTQEGGETPLALRDVPGRLASGERK